MGLLTVNERAGGDHFGKQQSAGTVQPMQKTAVAIGPGHHWGHRDQLVSGQGVLHGANLSKFTNWSSSARAFVGLLKQLVALGFIFIHFCLHFSFIF
jgi:hypothetical protein